jgi:hypothetical protein
MINHNAIRALNPSVVFIQGENAFDDQGNPVAYDRAAAEAWVDPEAYKTQRAAEYPDFRDYLDGVVKGDQAQIDAYIAACQAVKAKYPKP